jgi:hypothetical protein
MRLNLQAYLPTSDDLEMMNFSARETAPETKAPAKKKHVAKPRKQPNVAAARKRVFARYSKTLAYLAK